MAPTRHLPTRLALGEAGWKSARQLAEQGVDGLLRDKTRKPGRARLPLETVAKVLALPCSSPPGSATL